jgi:carboxylesterase type B
LESIIITHATDEAGALIPPRVNSTTLEILLSNIIPLRELTKPILERYPPTNLKTSAQTSTKFESERERFRVFAATHAFNCHVREIAIAYQHTAKVYLGRYSRGPGRHGDDLLPTFFDLDSSSYPLVSFLTELIDPGFSGFARTLQDYFLSLVRTGDPNKLKAQNAINWPTFTRGPIFQNVLDAGGKGFDLIKDNATTAESCDIFFKAWAEATIQGGKSFTTRFRYPA